LPIYITLGEKNLDALTETTTRKEFAVNHTKTFFTANNSLTTFEHRQ